MVSAICAKAAVAQQTDSVKTSTFFPLPLVFFTPETRWAFGAAAFYSWRLKDEPLNSRPSQLQLGFAYTLEDQILAYLPFQLYKENEKYTVFGEIGWYRYNYFYFGNGNEIPADYEELYGVNYPRLKLTGMYEFKPDLYTGLRVLSDKYRITELVSEGILVRDDTPGIEGGWNNAVGVIINFDNRDNYFATQRGWYLEAGFDFFGGYVGSDYEYQRLTLDFRKFFSLGSKNVIGANFYASDIYGEAPFITLSLLGGNKRLRGFYEGRYRDNTAALVQAEYRRELIGRFGFTLFGGSGLVADNIGDLSTRYLRSTYGGGLRFALNKEDRINIRFDVGIGNGEAAYYLTIGEAF